MSDHKVFGTPGEGHTRRKPSYSEVVKATPATRPAPINTDVTRAIQGGPKDSSTTAASGFWSAGNAPLDTGFTAPTLFSPSIWSPIHQSTRSATIAREDSWETTMNGKINEVIAAKAASPGDTVGLGVQFGDDIANMDGSNRASPRHNGILATSRSPYKYKQQDISGAQTKPYLLDNAVAHPKTAPLAQQPFIYSANNLAIKPINNQVTGDTTVGKPQTTISEESGHSVYHAVKENDALRAVLYITPSEGGSEGSGHAIPGIPISYPGGDISEMDCTHQISETGESEERDQRMQAPMIAEEPHPQNFIRTLMDGNIPFSTAFEGADTVCTAINPSHYAMEYGSRVICIKTDFVENIHWAIKHGRWVVMDRVAARIMQLYEARAGKKDKLLLIFSVNGQKSYCGLAEMSGPWIDDEGKTEGFKTKKEGGSKTWGTMPITWIFIKNVSYYWFRDIKNPQSDQDIANMWNGMHYPAGVARNVVERIISRPHFTNVLAWRQDETYDPFRPVLEASQIDPLAIDTRKLDNSQRVIENAHPSGNGQTRGQKVTRGAHSNRASALSLSTWRRPQERQQEEEETISSDTTLSYHRRLDVNQSLTPPNLDGHISPRPKTSQLVVCTMDKAGNLIPLPPDGSTAQNPVVSFKDNIIDNETPRGSLPTSHQQGRFATSSGGLPSFRGGRGGSGRGSFRGFNNAEGTFRVSSSPHFAHKHQPRLVGPQIRRMKSDAGLEDPFGIPPHVTQGNALSKVAHQNENGHTVPIGKSASFHREVRSANFEPQHTRMLAGSSNSAAQVSSFTASRDSGTSTAYAQDHSGGVMLAPTTTHSPMMDTPSRLPCQGSTKVAVAKRDLTPAGHQIYPSPIDRPATTSPTEHVVEKKSSDKGKSDAENVAAEYTEYLHRQQIIEAEMMRLKFKQAGLTVPEHLQTTIAAGTERG